MGYAGTIKEYLKNTNDANRYELLRGIACGLTFLHGEHSAVLDHDILTTLLSKDHTPQIIHGDMKPVCSGAFSLPS